MRQLGMLTNEALFVCSVGCWWSDVGPLLQLVGNSLELFSCGRDRRGVCVGSHSLVRVFRLTSWPIIKRVQEPEDLLMDRWPIKLSSLRAPERESPVLLVFFSSVLPSPSPFLFLLVPRVSDREGSSSPRFRSHLECSQSLGLQPNSKPLAKDMRLPFRCPSPNPCFSLLQEFHTLC